MKTKRFPRRVGGAGIPPGGLLLLFGVFLVLGWLNSDDLVWKPWGSWLAARSWKETPCTIVSSKVVETRGARLQTWFVTELAYTYDAGGQERRGTRYSFEPSLPSQALAALYPEGKVTTCWVDPGNPESAALRRDVSFGRLALIGLFPLLFLAAGAGGLLWMLIGGARKARRSR